jgi:hypothetical protein
MAAFRLIARHPPGKELLPFGVGTYDVSRRLEVSSYIS